MKFTKMQGCGNDYIYVNGFTEKIALEDRPELARKLSDRHFGIGSDGLIFINPSQEADFEMEMYNADGSRSQMCGNGIRCVGKYVYDKGMTRSTQIKVLSGGEIKHLELIVENGQVSRVRVNMGRPILEAARIPVAVEGERVIDQPIRVAGVDYRMTCVSMGNPHAVVFREGVADMDLPAVGPSFEYHERFPERVNTEFVEVKSPDRVFMRVWERGSGETLACGTGCCAVAVAGALNGYTKEEVWVELLGGELFIQWDREADLVYMTGPAVTVFEGQIDIPV